LRAVLCLLEQTPALATLIPAFSEITRTPHTHLAFQKRHSYPPDMEYLVLIPIGVLGAAYAICSIAEILLSLWDSVRDTTRRKTAGTLRAIIEPGEQSSRTEQSEMPPRSIEGKPGILIAASHRGYRKLLETWFRDQGFDVWATANGREALEQHRAQRGKIAAALLDVYMPIVDGARTLTLIRKENPSLPCVFMCKDLNKRLEKQLLALGANAVFEKPLLLPDVTAFIRDAMSTTARQTPAASETALVVTNKTL